MKMKTVYEANPALGDPMSIQGQLTENGQRLDKLRSDLRRYQAWLEEAEGKDALAEAVSVSDGTMIQDHQQAPCPAGTMVQGPVLGGPVCQMRWRVSPGQPVTPVSTIIRIQQAPSPARGELQFVETCSFV